MGDDRAGLAGPATEDLLRRFLDGRPEATARAYAADLSDLARFLGTPVEAAVGSLLLGPEPASRALLATARELGLVDWSVVPPGEEEVEAALERSREPEAPYVLPHNPDEVDRLDLQHFALREALGANFLAPVESPSRVLDVGTGTGQWGFEVCHRFPGALVVGFDLVRGKPNPPPGYRHVRGNLLQGLPFRDGSFDFVHQRF